MKSKLKHFFCACFDGDIEEVMKREQKTVSGQYWKRI